MHDDTISSDVHRFAFDLIPSCRSHSAWGNKLLIQVACDYDRGRLGSFVMEAACAARLLHGGPQTPPLQSHKNELLDPTLPTGYSSSLHNCIVDMIMHEVR